jgi:very-short-patch-repair endonuclease
MATESPIEADLLAALQAATDRVVVVPNANLGIVGRMAMYGSKIIVAPQVAIGSYRVDLLLAYGSKRLVVECDGAEFHTTAEQIARDAEREVAINRAGFEVVRLSGKQIVRDASKCAYSVLRRVSGLDFRSTGMEPLGAGLCRVLDGASIREEADAIADRVLGRAQP